MCTITLSKTVEYQCKYIVVIAIPVKHPKNKSKKWKISYPLHVDVGILSIYDLIAAALHLDVNSTNNK